jgi:hypothetical protein
MAFGASPFAHLSMAQKIGAVMSQNPVRIPSHPDAELRDVLARCLQRDAKVGPGLAGAFGLVSSESSGHRNAPQSSSFCNTLTCSLSLALPFSR